MSDVSEMLRRLVDEESVPPEDLDAIYARLRRRRTRQRVAATAIALIVAIAGTSLVVQAFTGARHQPNGPRPASPIDVGSLTPAWNVRIPHGATLNGIVADGRNVYVPTLSGVVAYPKSCSDPCHPAWSLKLERTRTEPQIATGDGIVAITNDGNLTVAPANCAAECARMWSGEIDGYASDAVVAGGVVKVAVAQHQDGQQRITLYGFDAQCRSDGGPCAPLWRAAAGTGTLYRGGPAVDGVFYQQVETTLWGFRADCADSANICQPDFEVKAAGNGSEQTSALYGPARSGDTLFVTSGAGLVLAYPEHCGTQCTPSWSAKIADYLEGAPRVAGDVVVASDARGVVALPTACSNPCEPAWRADLGMYFSLDYADENIVVATHRFKGQPVIALLPADCTTRCDALWTASFAGEVYGVTSDGAHVFAATNDQIRAYPVRCQELCASDWSGQDTGEAWWLFLDGSRLIAGSRSGGPAQVGASLATFESRQGSFATDPTSVPANVQRATLCASSSKCRNLDSPSN